MVDFNANLDYLLCFAPKFIPLVALPVLTYTRARASLQNIYLTARLSLSLSAFGRSQDRFRMWVHGIIPSFALTMVLFCFKYVRALPCARLFVCLFFARGSHQAFTLKKHPLVFPLPFFSLVCLCSL